MPIHGRHQRYFLTKTNGKRPCTFQHLKLRVVILRYGAIQNYYEALANEAQIAPLFGSLANILMGMEF